MQKSNKKLNNLNLTRHAELVSASHDSMATFSRHAELVSASRNSMVKEALWEPDILHKIKILAKVVNRVQGDVFGVQSDVIIKDDDQNKQKECTKSYKECVSC